MAIEVKVPALGESISSGILAGWQVKDGDYVEKEQVLYELETDKITSEGTAEAAGVIHLKAEEGDEVSIDEVIAEIDDSAEKPDGGKEMKFDGKSDDSEENSKSETSNEDESSGKDKSSGKEDGNAKKDESSSPAVSPAVRRMAKETGLDPSQVEGSGKGGRVIKGDMQAALEQRETGKKEIADSGKKSEPARSAPDKDSERETRKKLSPLRRSIAQRLVSVQNEAAILTTFNEVDMSGVMDLRKKYQDQFVERHGIKLGFMSFFVKAVVNGLKQVTQLNARVEGDEVVQNHFYDIGVAVSTEKGLMVPVLRDCDKKSFAGIEAELGNYAKKAREGNIQIEDLQGGVFSITNGGIFGSLLSTPIINPPQSGILGMHTIQQRPVAVNGEVVIRPMMYLALSYDHRIVDGKEAVTFLVSLKNSIEDPARMLFDA